MIACILIKFLVDKIPGSSSMWEDHIRQELFERLHAILEEAAKARDVDNNAMLHDVVMEAVRYAGVVRQEYIQSTDPEPSRKGRFWHSAK
jgi:hypothetical protein